MMTNERNDGESPKYSSLRIAMVLIALLLALGGIWYRVQSNAGDSDLMTTGFGVLLGTILLLVTLLVFAAVLKPLDLANHPFALGLPQGSVRAVLAIGLVCVFVSISLLVLDTNLSAKLTYFETATVQDAGAIETMREVLGDDYAVVAEQKTKDGPFTAKIYRVDDQGAKADLTKQIVTTIATALVSIVGFYFGSRSVSLAANETQGSPAAEIDRKEKLASVEAAANSGAEILQDASASAARATNARDAASKLEAEADASLRARFAVNTRIAKKASTAASKAVDRARVSLEELKALRKSVESIAAGSAQRAEALVTATALVEGMRGQLENAQSAAERAERALRRSMKRS